MTPNNDPPRVKLCVRDHVSSSTYDRQKEVYEQLVRFRKEEIIAELSIEVWGKQARADANGMSVATEGASPVSSGTYEELKSWTERAGYSLEPGFSTLTLESFITDRREEVIRFPIMCLAAYDGDELIDVAPRSSTDEVYTVEDFLTTLRSAEKQPAGVEENGRIESD